jgi:DnaJ-class molecular chaperone
LGDLVFDFVVEPHPNFTLLGRGDLGYTLNISLVEALVGFAHNVTLPNGRNVTVAHQGISPAGKLPLHRVSLHTLRVSLHFIRCPCARVE